MPTQVIIHTFSWVRCRALPTFRSLVHSFQSRRVTRGFICLDSTSALERKSRQRSLQVCLRFGKYSVTISEFPGVWRILLFGLFVQLEMCRYSVHTGRKVRRRFGGRYFLISGIKVKTKFLVWFTLLLLYGSCTPCSLKIFTDVSGAPMASLSGSKSNANLLGIYQYP